MSVPDTTAILQEIQRKIKSNWDSSTGEAAKEIYSSIYDLTGQVILLAQNAPAPIPVPDALTACLTENQSLKSQLDACKKASGDINFLTLTLLDIGRTTGLPADKHLSELSAWVRDHWKP